MNNQITCPQEVRFVLMIAVLLVGCDDQGDKPLDLGLPPLSEFGVMTACSDGLDNDGDGLIDFPQDPGCIDLRDIEELDPSPDGPCEDQLDNDNDGLIDFDDPGCVLSEGLEEYQAPLNPECSNGEDDDGDGYIDYPADESCTGPQGEDESLIPTPSACQNLMDDDFDGLIDFPYDPGCASPEDTDETDQLMVSMIPQCNDGVDNDLDGYVDLADSSCVTPSDPRERQSEDAAIPACSNGMDDDGDGLIDFREDPGCVGPGGSSEIDPMTPPACADQIDNDANGYTDYPDDPGCHTLGDPTEESPMLPPACLDGRDNDEDGWIDFPQDVGCESASDTDERGSCIGSPAILELSNGTSIRGTSRQGRFARSGSCGGAGAPEVTAIYHVHKPLRALIFETGPASEGEEGWETTLYARTRCDESHLEIACVREEVDGEASNRLVLSDPPLGPLYLIIDGASGAGGSFLITTTEIPIEACQNGEDDDRDGYIDFPLDPGCLDPLDESEETPTPPPSCTDGVDNDGDGLTDYPDDIGCLVASDDDEVDECGQGLPVDVIIQLPHARRGDLREEGRTSEHMSQCGGQGIERVIRYENPSHASLEINLSRTDGVLGRAYLYVRGLQCDDQAELGCLAQEIGGPPLELPDEGEDVGGPTDPYAPDPRLGVSMTLNIPSAPQGPLYLFIDHDLDGFPYHLTIKRAPLPPRCVDGVDNDGDGFIDADDSGCQGPEDESEATPPRLPACSDGLDNDGDGWTDYPLDLGCAYRGGESEDDPEQLPSCSNGIDDNGDGFTDFPFDLGCSARGDDTEANLPILPACGNLLDDDLDGLSDFPYDPGCVARGDGNEEDNERHPQCDDGVDNDQNGWADYPLDPGCYAKGDPHERPAVTPPACSDGIDNDGDGAIDLPYDPGCSARGDESEQDPFISPECANGLDDDLNGRTDWPDDPGCYARADGQEDLPYVPPPRCSDGVDNDDDGLIDGEDLNCSSALDQSEGEASVGEPSWPVDDIECSDGVDNDGDGHTDWPADSGCAAAGDTCERGGYQRCSLSGASPTSGCVDLVTDPLHCGSCGAQCTSGVCRLGRCQDEPPTLRPQLMYCGSSTRPITGFLTGPLQNTTFIISAGCDPDDQVHALMVTRLGRSGLTLNRDLVREYVFRGGQVITERGISAHVMRELFGLTTPDGALVGDCLSNIQPPVIYLDKDPLWSIVPHLAPPEGESGCGLDLSGLTGIVRLGGWDEERTSLAYFEYGRGRVWLVESNWRDANTITEESGHLMAAMIMGGGRPISPESLPECMDRIDNDRDGVVDLFDEDCQSSRDMTERSFSQSLSSVINCADGIDNDQDELIDFPWDQGCAAAGDLTEDLLEIPEGEEEQRTPECSDNLDNDGDGFIDWPTDLGCSGAGDFDESDYLLSSSCANGQDDDLDGRIDYPSDPQCLARSWPSELSAERGLVLASSLIIDTGRGAHPVPERRAGCSNGADDDGDGRADYPADEQCLTPLDHDEQGEDSELTLEERLTQFVDPLPSCMDGLDNDGDGHVDLEDSSCLTPTSDELDEILDPLPECANAVDDDEDGQLDWPEEVHCLSAGDQNEQATCSELTVPRLGAAIHSIPTAASTQAELDLWDEVVPTGCAKPPQRGQVRFISHDQDGPLTVRFSEQPTEINQPDYVIAVQLWRGCDEAAQPLVCQQINLSDPDPDQRTLSLPWLPAGEVLLTLSAASPARWESHALPMELPPDPRGYQAADDVTSICWQDGGHDSFDCMGRVELTRGEDLFQLDVSLGIHSLPLETGYTLMYASEKPHSQVWRVRYWTIGQPSSDQEISFKIAGNLGLDGLTIPLPGEMNVGGIFLPYQWYTNDLIIPTKPPVLTLVVPGGTQELATLSATSVGDNLVTETGAISLPLTTYITSSYLPREHLVDALKRDINLFGEALVAPITPLQVEMEIIR